MAAKKKRLGAKDIERLENTSVASVLLAAGHVDAAAHESCGGLSCIGVSCYGGGATCVNGTALTLECIGITCNGINATVVVQTVATCGGVPQTPQTPPTPHTPGGGGGCGIASPSCVNCTGSSCSPGRATGPMTQFDS